MTAPIHKRPDNFGHVLRHRRISIFAVMNVFAKILSEHHHVIEIAFYRNAIAALPMLFLIFAMGKREIMTIRSNPRTIVARSVIGTASAIATFRDILPLASATKRRFVYRLAHHSRSGVFTSLGNASVLTSWTAILVGFAGVLVMLSQQAW